jgi:hypothetical protein
LDLVIATHGRGIYVLDGAQVFEEWTPRALTDSVSFFSPRAAWAFHKRSLGGKWGSAQFSAKNPPFGALLDYFVPRDLDGGVSFAIADSAGHAVRTLTGSGDAGFHRVTWDLTAGDPKVRIRRTELSGQPPLVPPGRYKVTLTAGKAAPRERTLDVKALPGVYLSEL